MADHMSSWAVVGMSAVVVSIDGLCVMFRAITSADIEPLQGGAW